MPEQTRVPFTRFDDRDESGALGWRTHDSKWVVIHTEPRGWYSVYRRLDPDEMPAEDPRWYDERWLGGYYEHATDTPRLKEAREYVARQEASDG